MEVLIALAVFIVMGFIALYFALAWTLTNEIKKENPLTKKMGEDLGTMNRQLISVTEYTGNLKEKLASMQDIGKNIADLRTVLSSPKLRGNFGERLLQDMLETYFPHDLYRMQFKFKDGQIVDALIKTKDGFIPVDSKFPVDNFRKMLAAENDETREAERHEFMKSVKKHIGDIAKKYILPAEKTTDFAVMYVPSEAVFYEIVSSTDELTRLAEQQKVLMVSPNTMSYFLHILRIGHERTRIEENVQKVFDLLSGLQQETMKFGEAMGVLSRHVTNAKNSMDDLNTGFTRLSSKVDQIKQLK